MRPLSGDNEWHTALRSKTFTDPFHGDFNLQAVSVAVVDTRVFKRLQHLHQLGVAHHVFPGANHTRFQHSLGVAHLAGRWGRHLLRSNRVDGSGLQPLRLLSAEDERDIVALELAGLTHDLGHGPFSHVFEAEVLPRLVGPERAKAWSHEMMSNQLLELLYDSHHIDLEAELGLSRADLQLVQRLVAGGPLQGVDLERRWLFDIVANQRTGIDVDKFDYLVRDSHATGVATSLDFEKIMRNSRIGLGEVAFSDKEYMTLYRGLFGERAHMHTQVYTHPQTKAIEFMVADALAAVEPELQLARKAHSPAEFAKLDDTLLRQVEMMDAEASEHSRAVRKAHAILDRLHKWDLYRFADEWNITPEYRQQYSKPVAADIVAHQSSDGQVTLTAEDIIVSECRVDFTKREQNPLDVVSFYNHAPSTFKLDPRTITSCIPIQHMDYKLRIFTRRSDPRVVEAARRAFRAWLSSRFGSKAELSLDSSQPRKRKRSLDDDAELACGGPWAAAAASWGTGQAAVPVLVCGEGKEDRSADDGADEDMMGTQFTP